MINRPLVNYATQVGEGLFFRCFSNFLDINTQQQYDVVLIWLGSLGSDWVYGDGQAVPCMGGAWHRCMSGAWHGVCWVGGVGS